MSMKTRKSLFWVAAGYLAVMATVSLTIVLRPTDAAPAGSVKTAQSVMVDVKSTGSAVIIDSETWSYNEGCATSNFTNGIVGGPTVSFSWTGTAAPDGVPPTQPVTPLPPSPISQKLSSVVGANQCTFFDGGQLIGGDPYDQSVSVDVQKSVTTVNPKTGKSTTTTYKGKYTFTWTYQVTVNDLDPVADGLQNVVAARTCWDLTDATNGLAKINVNGSVAGESANTQSGGKWTRKYSFTLTSGTDPLTGSPISRVSNVTVKITGTDAAGNAVELSNSPEVTLAGYEIPITNPDGTTSRIVNDFYYKPNGGSFGATSTLTGEGLVSAIVGPAPTVPAADGKLDDFAGNDGLGGTQGILANSQFELAAGDYTVTVTGTVKDNTGTLTSDFSVTREIHIHAGKCSAPGQ